MKTHRQDIRQEKVYQVAVWATTAVYPRQLWTMLGEQSPMKLTCGDSKKWLLDKIVSVSVSRIARNFFSTLTPIQRV